MYNTSEVYAENTRYQCLFHFSKHYNNLLFHISKINTQTIKFLVGFSGSKKYSPKRNLWGQLAINWKVLIEYTIDCSHIRQLPVYYTLWAV